MVFVTERVREASTMKRPWPTRDCLAAMGKKIRWTLCSLSY